MSLRPITPEAVFDVIRVLAPVELSLIQLCFNGCGAHHARRRRVTLTVRHLQRRGAIHCLDRLWEADPPPADVLESMLLLVGLDPQPTEKECAGLTAWQRFLSQEWAAAVHLRASDNVIRVPPVPAWLADRR